MNLYNGQFVKARWLFEPRDCWVGLFWKVSELCLHFYVCIVPCLPVQVTILKRWFRDKGLRDWERPIQ